MQGCSAEEDSYSSLQQSLLYSKSLFPFWKGIGWKYPEIFLIFRIKPILQITHTVIVQGQEPKVMWYFFQLYESIL